MFLLGTTLGHPPPFLPCLGRRPPLAKHRASTLVRNSPPTDTEGLTDRPLDIPKDLLAMQTRRYIKTIYFGEA